MARHNVLVPSIEFLMLRLIGRLRSSVESTRKVAVSSSAMAAAIQRFADSVITKTTTK
jgi:hypothetical protein